MRKTAITLPLCATLVVAMLVAGMAGKPDKPPGKQERGPIRLRLDFAPTVPLPDDNPVAPNEVWAGAWQSDTYKDGQPAPYIDGQEGLLCLGDNIGNLQIDTGGSPRTIWVNYPTWQRVDGWLTEPTYLEAGYYDFDQLQLYVHDIPSPNPRNPRSRGGLEDLVIGVKYDCHFGLFLSDPSTGKTVAWNSHWHWGYPEPDLYMVRVAIDQWELVNNGYINHYFAPENPEDPSDHPVFMPFKIVLTKLPS